MLTGPAASTLDIAGAEGEQEKGIRSHQEQVGCSQYSSVLLNIIVGMTCEIDACSIATPNGNDGMPDTRNVYMCQRKTENLDTCFGM
jgi:hypothetical protein